MANNSVSEQARQVLFNDRLEVNDPEKLLAYQFQQYNLYLTLADKISERRQTANSFFLTVNSGICAAIGYLFSKDSAIELKPLFWCIPIVGILLSYFWVNLVTSYKQLNAGKFKVVHLIEERLPLALYDAEWVMLGKGEDKKLYQPLTHVEVQVPRLFIGLYFTLLAFFLWKAFHS